MPMKQIVTAVFIIILIVIIIILAFTINQVQNEDQRLRNDMLYRTTLLAESLQETVEPNFVTKSEDSLQSVVDKFTDRERFAGLGIYDNKGQTIAASTTIPEATASAQKIIAEAMDSDRAIGEFTTFSNKRS